MFKKKIEEKLGAYFLSLIEQEKARILANRYQDVRLRLKHCGEGVKFNGDIRFHCPENIEIYDNVHFNDGSFLSGLGRISIGRNTHIARNFLVYSSNHNYKGKCLPYDEVNILKPVFIDKNVWIGANVVVVPGASIGAGAIIAAGTIVSQDVPPLAIIGSQPSRILKYRENEHYERLEREKRYGGVSGQPLILD